MRIGIFTDTYLPYVSGVSTSIKMLRDSLIEMGHDVYIVTANLKNYRFIYDKKEKILYLPGIKTGIYDARLTGFYSTWAMHKIKSWHLDVIHSNTEFGIGAFSRIVKKKLDIPTVHTYHTLYDDYVYYVTHGHFEKASKKALIAWTRYFADTSTDELIIPTEKIRKLFYDEYNITKNINVIPTGIDTHKFELKNINADELKELRKKYNLEKDDFVIGTVGRIAKEKSLDKLIEAMPYLIKESKKIKLLIIGDGPIKEDLEKLVKELKIENNVIFTGKVMYQFMPIYYHLANVIATYSTTETQGLTVIEALASSLPAICINDPSFTGTVVSNYNGYLFNDTKDFQNKIIEIKNDEKLYKEMCKNAKNSIYKYSREVFAAEVLKVYVKAIEDKKKENVDK